MYNSCRAAKVEWHKWCPAKRRLTRATCAVLGPLPDGLAITPGNIGSVTARAGSACVHASSHHHETQSPYTPTMMITVQGDATSPTRSLRGRRI